jgi:Zn-finger protein
MANYDYFQNRSCEYFPCHKGADSDNFNCLFCYCPLYALGDRCGGNFRYTENGVKDCSLCLYPHRRENYGKIMDKMALVLEMAKKPPEKP